VRTLKASDRAIPDKMHAAGASTSISRTITPEKYTEVTKYRTKNELASDKGKKHDMIPAGTKKASTLIPIK